MDFGMVGLDSETSLASLTTTTSSDPETKQQQQKWYGSGFLKQERSENNTGGGGEDVDDDDWRSLKVAKTDDFSVSKAMLLQQQQRNNHPSSLRSNNSLFSDGQHQQHQQQQQMLSFSSPKSSEAFLHRNDTTGATFPYYYPTQSPCNRNTGYNSGNLNAASMHGFLTGVRGPFTPSQWMELEHQALIYKYINANVPIPSNLLIPIKRALDSAGFSTFSGIPFRPNTMGWGSFHLGFSSNTDPEPGRCRRTDGKKWRCSRDAVADQKYCERHINRGRHRSRKPVEGQSGHSVAGTTTTTTTKPMSIASSSSASVVSGGGNSSGMPYSLAMTQHHQVKHLQPSASDTSAAAQINKIYMNKENMGEGMLDTPVLSMLSSTTNLNSKDSSFSIPKQRMPYEESSRSEFGFVSSDCLLNPSKKSFTFMNCKNYNSSKELTDREAESQHSLRPFMDDWPKNQSERSTISWPDMGMQSDRTQLSISIPMAPSDFMSSTSSPTNEKPALSPLRLSRELDQIQMGLGVGNVSNEQNHRQANWIPISWETSVGGPLGEVLHNTNSNKVDYKNPSALNLMTEGWDNSPRLGSSPTGVLQKTTFGSLSNSSAGSSPRAENNRTHEGSSFCNDPLGSTLVNSSSFPSL